MRRKLLTIGILAVCTALLMIACLSVFRQKQEARRQMMLEMAERFLNEQILVVGEQKSLPSSYAFSFSSDERLELNGGDGETVPIRLESSDPVRLSMPWPAQDTALTLTKDGQTVYSGDPEGLTEIRLENGTYEGDITCLVDTALTSADGTTVRVTGAESYTVLISVEIPTGFRLSRDEMIQGSAVAVIGTNIFGEVTGTCPGVMDDINFSVDGNGNALALLSTTFRCAPGTYECKVTWNGETTVLPFTVTEGTYEVQHLTISTSTAAATVGNSDAMADYNGMIAATNLIWTPERYYEDQFIMPVNGPITTEFGLYRYTNGSSTPSRHVGIDIAEDEGMPVAAAASGRVAVARWVGTTGYTVCIDHGYGVRSYYYHMSALSVGKDDFVVQGQEIGKVGQTGYANGPHVHFNIMVGDNSINPWPVIDGTSGIFDLPADVPA